MVTIVASILSVPAFLLTLPPIQEYFFNKDPKLTLTIASEVPVFDGGRNITGLQVRFGEDNLTSPPRMILATSARLSNEGGASITPDMVTKIDPIGIRIRGGKFIQISRTRASSIHLRKFSAPHIVNASEIVLKDDIILDPGDYVDLDFLVLSPGGKNIVYSASGKVAGQSTPVIIDRRSGDQKESFLANSFSGGVRTQIVRLIFYFIVMFGLMFLLMLAVELVQGIKIRRIHRKIEPLANLTKEGLDPGDVPKAEIALGLFEYLGYDKFVELILEVGKLPVFEQTRNTPDYVLSPNGRIAAKRGAICGFLLRTETRPNGVDYVLESFGLVVRGEGDPSFIRISESVKSSAEETGLKEHGGMSEIEIITLYSVAKLQD